MIWTNISTYRHDMSPQGETGAKRYIGSYSRLHASVHVSMDLYLEQTLASMHIQHAYMHTGYAYWAIFSKKVLEIKNLQM